MSEKEPQHILQTADEIANEFPDEWIAMKVVSVDEGRTPLGFSIHHSRDSDEIFSIAKGVVESGGKVYIFHGSPSSLITSEEDSLDRLLADMGKYEPEDQ